jgi:hypothetical protein
MLTVSKTILADRGVIVDVQQSVTVPKAKRSGMEFSAAGLAGSRDESAHVRGFGQRCLLQKGEKG